MEYIVTNCIVHGVLDDIQPHSYGLLMNNELVGVMLGTKEKFPKIWQSKELQPIQGPVAVNFFSLMADMQLGAMSKSQGQSLRSSAILKVYALSQKHAKSSNG